MTDVVDRPIREVTQTILYDHDLNAQGVYGNCMQAALAAFFDMPIDAVPHFVAFRESWQQAVDLWLDDIGWEVNIQPGDEIPDERCLITGPSPRGVSHIVVAEGGRIVWDPHPSRSGIEQVRFVWRFHRLGLQP